MDDWFGIACAGLNRIALQTVVATELRHTFTKTVMRGAKEKTCDKVGCFVFFRSSPISVQ